MLLTATLLLLLLMSGLAQELRKLHYVRDLYRKFTQQFDTGLLSNNCVVLNQFLNHGSCFFLPVRIVALVCDLIGAEEAVETLSIKCSNWFGSSSTVLPSLLNMWVRLKTCDLDTALDKNLNVLTLVF